MISIIIIVKNDFRIEKLLQTLTTSSLPQKTEIIVVDASTPTFLSAIQKKYNEVRWIYYEQPRHKKRTYAEQRNIGITHAKGDIIAFIDADCVPEKNWITQLSNPIQKEHEYIVSGAVRSSGNRVHIEETYGTYRTEAETMNLAIAKSVFEKIGMFDEQLEGCEDSDFCIRAIKKGYKIRFQKKAIVYHDWGNWQHNMVRSYHGGKDRVHLYKKYPWLLTSFSPNNIYTIYYVVFIIGLPITFLFPLYPFILFIPSVIKRRNPLKEFFNICFAVGIIKETIHGII